MCRWDCHGLPIEHQVDKNLGPKKKELSKIEIRKLCREYAEKYINIQRDEFKRLGVFGDWNNPYLTMDYKYEGSIVRELGKVVGKGSVYVGRSLCYGAFRARLHWQRQRWSIMIRNPHLFM